MSLTHKLNGPLTIFLGRPIKWLFITCVMVLSGCSYIERASEIADISIGTGHSAHELCSRTFVSNQPRDLIDEDVLVQKVHPLQNMWQVEMDDKAKTVKIGAPFFLGLNQGTAVYREGLGCTLVHDQSIESVKNQEVELASVEALSEDLFWPEGSKGIDPAINNDYPLEDINKIVDEMFLESDSDRFKQINTQAVLVVHNGKLIAEKYSEELSHENRLIGWSMSKTISALLLGVLNKQGKAHLEEEIVLSATHPHTLQLKHVLNMSSGLDFNEQYLNRSSVSEMLYQNEEMISYVNKLDMKYKPGEKFNYSTGDTQILADLVHKKLGSSIQNTYDFYQKELFHKLGINNAVFEHDASGTPIGGARVLMRPRDWARIGLMLANNGRWQDKQIILETWVDFIRTPSPAANYYGGQVWLADIETTISPHNDIYYLQGVLGQFVVVVPSKNLVVVRQGAWGSDLNSYNTAQDTVWNPVGKIIDLLPIAH